jgi:16S rRNA (guanine527-N7)-methyltransferase
MGAFEDELHRVLPNDLPERESVIRKTARHLEWIEEANRHFNLTRIQGARDAAIKHVLDSLLPWAHFSGARRVLDAGTGAGFPGLPLALVLPHVAFTLAESTGKKARFVESVVAELGLTNVAVVNERAEDWLRANHTDLITGRALAPLDKACGFFANAIRGGARALLYKGPDVELEITAAGAMARKCRVQLKVIERYELPDGAGTRTLVEIASAKLIV